jgi:hypothetical protein
MSCSACRHQMTDEIPSSEAGLCSTVPNHDQTGIPCWTKVLTRNGPRLMIGIDTHLVPPAGRAAHGCFVMRKKTFTSRPVGVGGHT